MFHIIMYNSSIYISFFESEPKVGVPIWSGFCTMTKFSADNWHITYNVYDTELILVMLRKRYFWYNWIIKNGWGTLAWTRGVIF